jgi:hypothetical protein
VGSGARPSSGLSLSEGYDKESVSHGGRLNVLQQRHSLADLSPGHFEEIHGFMQLFNLM